MRTRKLVIALLATLVLFGVTLPAAAESGLALEPPVPGPVEKGFTAGPHPWSPGHRGVDLAAPAGTRVRAAAMGTVHFAGSVAGRPSVSVDHGNGLRTTYTPVRASVSAGDVVAAGDVIGELATGHCATGCLHWGLTDGTRYFDPLAYLDVREVRLLPAGTTPEAPPQLAASLVQGTGELPVSGRLTSHFGMRRHPVTGVYKLHDGLDIAASCGTPVSLPWSGTVTRVERHPAYGNRVIVEHPDGSRSGYAHLQQFSVREGQSLAASAQLGAVGNTGLSTGCHLHWMTWRGGQLVDPLTLAGSN